MANRVDDIAALLWVHPTLGTAAAIRKTLNERFAQLTSEEAAQLLERLLRPDRSRTPSDFRVLSRHVRLELVLRLAGKLSKPTRSAILARLDGPAADPALQRGRRLMFPPGTGLQRKRFMKALAGPERPATFPSVTLLFRNHGRFSDDNACEVLTKPQEGRLLPDKLGVFADGRAVWMEIQGTVRHHQPEATYKFSRTKETLLLCRDATGWREIGYKKPGTQDDEHPYFGGEGTDEDGSPELGHIYVVDGPNLPEPGHDSRSGDVEAVKFLNFVERLDIKVRYPKYVIPAAPIFLPWCVRLWIEKRQGEWKLNEEKSGNRKGTIDFAILRQLLAENAAKRRQARAGEGDLFIVPVDPTGFF